MTLTNTCSARVQRKQNTKPLYVAAQAVLGYMNTQRQFTSPKTPVWHHDAHQCHKLNVLPAIAELTATVVMRKASVSSEAHGRLSDRILTNSTTARGIRGLSFPRPTVVENLCLYFLCNDTQICSRQDLFTVRGIIQGCASTTDADAGT